MVLAELDMGSGQGCVKAEGQGRRGLEQFRAVLKEQHGAREQ